MFTEQREEWDDEQEEEWDDEEFDRRVADGFYGGDT